ncbi:hypothetical protein DFA_04026 [Cavenderia fasciculata]|uniref:Uncharacterized protein n=1 Tax=Cavenderia fasciculata TaxID=261658 RepID=F4Q131_CACFS|nr:uncharacterized protein DFA_04026 [Cavenderia fasciculata]EGG18532.1 hypothetical protein DFA_04026 [Cavenderia fasciculata]|eukprot:XP_004366436.1 hypothetical protein DFA_04026 [Cavenderia fasciculata]
MQRGLYCLANKTRSLSNVLVNNNKCTNIMGSLVGLQTTTLNKTTTSTTSTSTRNYATFNDKKFEAIKKRRDEEKRAEKIAAEQKFIEASRLSIQDLSFEDALNNLRDKYNKYAVVANSQMTTLFRKAENTDELEQALLFYKSIRNDRPDYFTDEQISLLFYAFERNNAVMLWADVLIHTHTFQIFASGQTVSKSIYHLLRLDSEEATQKAIEMYQDRLVRYSGFSNIFIENIAYGLKRSNNTERIYSLLALADPRVHLSSAAVKTILRGSFASDTTKQALDVLAPYLPSVKRTDGIYHSTILMAKIIANNPQEESQQQEAQEIYKSWDAKQQQLFKEKINSEIEKENHKDSLNNFINQI